MSNTIAVRCAPKKPLMLRLANGENQAFFILARRITDAEAKNEGLTVVLHPGEPLTFKQ